MVGLKLSGERVEIRKGGGGDLLVLFCKVCGYLLAIGLIEFV